MRRSLLIMVVVATVLIGLVACNEPAPPPPPQIIDAPQLSAAIKWLGVCGVLCSLCGAIGLIAASRNRRK